MRSSLCDPDQHGLGVRRRNEARLVVRRLASLVGHLEEQKVGKLLDIVAIARPVVSEDAAVIPDSLDEGGGIHE